MMKNKTILFLCFIYHTKFACQLSNQSQNPKTENLFSALNQTDKYGRESLIINEAALSAKRSGRLSSSKIFKL